MKRITYTCGIISLICCSLNVYSLQYDEDNGGQPWDSQPTHGHTLGQSQSKPLTNKEIQARRATYFEAQFKQRQHEAEASRPEAEEKARIARSEARQRDREKLEAAAQAKRDEAHFWGKVGRRVEAEKEKNRREEELEVEERAKKAAAERLERQRLLEREIAAREAKSASPKTQEELRKERLKHFEKQHTF